MTFVPLNSHHPIAPSRSNRTSANLVKSGHASWVITDRSRRSTLESRRNLKNVNFSLIEARPSGAECLAAAPLALGGITWFSGSDWPGKLAAVFFLQSCPLRCSYCHNPHLLAHTPGSLDFLSTLGALASRRELLDGVVFSGGEPCAQSALPSAISATRNFGFQVGLHTSGVFPVVLERALPHLDWVGLDIKAPPPHFAKITGYDGWRRVQQSLDLLLAADVPFETRTTWHPDMFASSELLALAEQLQRQGVKEYSVQRLRTPVDEGRRWITGPAPEPTVLSKLQEMFTCFTLR